MTDIPDSDSQEMTEEKKEALRNLAPKEERITEAGHLPTWVKTALTKWKLGYHDTLKEAAEIHNRAAATLYNWKSTPAAKGWLESVGEIADDPVKFSENLLRGQFAGFTIDFMEMYQAAYEAEDYAELRKFWESIADRLPDSTLKSSGDAEGNTGTAIQINISGTPEEISGESEFETIEADWDEVDDG